jgi:hypothetical protein
MWQKENVLSVSSVRQSNQQRNFPGHIPPLFDVILCCQILSAGSNDTISYEQHYVSWLKHTLSMMTQGKLFDRYWRFCQLSGPNSIRIVLPHVSFFFKTTFQFFLRDCVMAESYTCLASSQKTLVIFLGVLVAPLAWWIDTRRFYLKWKFFFLRIRK